jgi:periplasmic divalent cation tolerance protein
MASSEPRWHGEIFERVEGRASLHTRTLLIDAIVSRVKEDHPYEVPSTSARPIIDGNPDYLSWMIEETNSPH